jgi:hypothetical protein
MELNFSEISSNSNLDNDNSHSLKYDFNNLNLKKEIKNEVINKQVTFNTYNTYWDPKPEYEKVEPKKNNVSYDDILNSMNMVVINGRLHFVPNNKFQNTQMTPQQSTIQNQNKSIRQNVNQNVNQNINQNGNQNSYIFDKYFKNYQQEQAANEIPKVPLTPDEIKRNIILHRLKQIEERKRIEQIKPKKLLFNTSNINISQQGNNPPNLNKLFRFSNR